MAGSFKEERGKWRRLINSLSSHNITNRVVKKHLLRATKLNGKLLERAIRKSIKDGTFEKNAPLTIALKGSSKPLVDSGELFKSIKMKVIDYKEVFVGILKTESKYNLGVFLHEGGEIKVTKKMRGLFYILWQASINKISESELTARAKELFDKMPSGWKPLSKNTKVISVESRPFISYSAEDNKFKALCRNNWEIALKTAFKEIKDSI